MLETSNSKERPLAVVTLTLDTAERLPCLVEQETWLPLRVATRWALRYRRYRVQVSTLNRNLHSLKRLYEWAWSVAGIDLDEFLLAGRMLNARQVESLAAYLRGDVREIPGQMKGYCWRNPFFPDLRGHQGRSQSSKWCSACMGRRSIGPPCP
jgi:hypothetical protein